MYNIQQHKKQRGEEVNCVHNYVMQEPKKKKKHLLYIIH